MNKMIAAALLGSFGFYAMHGSKISNDGPKLLAHPNSAVRFEGCPALGDAGLDDDTANSFLSARSPASAGQVNVSIGVDLLAGSTDSQEHKRIEQSAENMAISNLVCAAAKKDVSLKFGHGWFSRHLDRVYVTRNGNTLFGTFEQIGSGLDGEPRLAFKTFGSLGTLSTDESDATPFCLISSKRDINITNGISSFLEGSLVGMIMGSGGEFDRVFTSTCRTVLTDFGENRV